ncbi:MAG: SET domain-containing protein, partial [Alphaproteobacteria bacterium]
ERSMHLAGKNDFKVFRSAAGLGLQACRNFGKSDVLVQYTGRQISNQRADANPNRYLFELDDRWTIDGSPRSNLARYINHSCAPNARAVYDEAENGIYIEAIATIRTGDEITYDYGDQHFEEYIKPSGCKCPKCASGRSNGRT